MSLANINLMPSFSLAYLRDCVSLATDRDCNLWCRRSDDRFDHWASEYRHRISRISELIALDVHISLTSQSCKALRYSHHLSSLDSSKFKHNIKRTRIEQQYDHDFSEISYDLADRRCGILICWRRNGFTAKDDPTPSRRPQVPSTSQNVLHWWWPSKWSHSYEHSDQHGRPLKVAENLILVDSSSSPALSQDTRTLCIHFIHTYTSCMQHYIQIEIPPFIHPRTVMNAEPRLYSLL